MEIDGDGDADCNCCMPRRALLNVLRNICSIMAGVFITNCCVFLYFMGTDGEYGAVLLFAFASFMTMVTGIVVVPILGIVYTIEIGCRWAYAIRRWMKFTINLIFANILTYFNIFFTF
jgi:hypothetical protein